MTKEEQLQLQAWVDGELPASVAAEVAGRVQRDAELKAFADELGAWRNLFQSNPPLRRVPDTREFYWSQIRRGIEQTERATTSPHHAGGLAWLWRWLAPTAAAAAFVLVTLLMIQGPRRLSAAAIVGQEIETPLDEMTSLTFHSQQDAMTIVWVERTGALTARPPS